MRHNDLDHEDNYSKKLKFMYESYTFDKKWGKRKLK